MKRSFLIIFLLLIQGCSVISHGRLKSIPLNIIEQIEIGLTTKENLLSLLGPPQRIAKKPNNVEVLLYSHGFERSLAVPFFLSVGRAGGNGQVLTVSLQNGKVIDYELSIDQRYVLKEPPREKKTKTKTIGANFFDGLGSTISIEEVKKIEGAVNDKIGLWTYHFRREPLPFLFSKSESIQSIEKGTGMKLRVKSEHPTIIALVLKEEGNAQYEKRFSLNGDKWEIIELKWSDMTIQENSVDDNKSLDLEKIKQIIFVDLGAFANTTGKNRVWIDEIHGLTVR